LKYPEGQLLSAVQLSVSSWPIPFRAMAFDSLIVNYGMEGTGFSIRNNIVMNNRGRGILLKSGNGVVDGNKIVAPAWWGMQVGPNP
jgi:parallel beta-helix repeat protein